MRFARALAPAALAAAALALSPGAAQAAQRPKPVDLDVLFIGAHPDDEAFTLATLGQWGERYGVRSGVVTITRGEGGGNAVGPEEGPALGLLREGEERRAVGKAGIRHVYNLDKVDFYYTVSQPLTEQVWGHDDTLERVVRVIRETRPDVILTMDPAPSPGNHGNHQEAAHMAVEAWSAAADRSAFRSQIQREGLRPWRVKRLFRGGAGGQEPLGRRCATRVTPASPADEVYGVWSGARSRLHDTTWAAVAREAQREYASQGWAVFPDVPDDPSELSCDTFTQIASRVPHAIGGTSPDAMLQGAVRRAPGGLPLGTELAVTPSRFDLSPGAASRVSVRIRAAKALARGRVSLRLPRGWKGSAAKRFAPLAAGRARTVTFQVTPPAGTEAESRARLTAVLRAGRATGRAAAPVRIAPAVRGTLEPLAEVGEFQRWADRHGLQPLDDLVLPRQSLGTGESRTLRVQLRNTSRRAQSGQVSLDLPAGFAADAASKSYGPLRAGRRAVVSFTVTNTNPALATSNEGPEGGDYPVRVTTTSGSGRAVRPAALNLVPVTRVPGAATAPAVDGVQGAGEYPGPQLDLSRVWEGDDPSSAADASGWAKLAWSGDALYVFVHVVDDRLGAVLAPSDAKRHWRTDSVELAFDPRGNAPNTSDTFKVGIFPLTDDPQRGNPPAAYRDADAHQGPIAETAPGMTVASRVSSPYTGYDLETRIPLADLPAAVRPEGIGLNAFIYDSDTKDKTGQTRLGWSTWGGVQGDPYRWGHAVLEGYTPPAGRPTEPGEAIFPREAARSVESGQSILQASRDGVPLAGRPAARRDARITRVRLTGGRLAVRVRTTGAGTLHVYAGRRDGRAVAGRTVTVRRAGQRTVRIPVSRGDRASVRRGYALVAFAAGGGSVSRSAAVR